MARRKKTTARRRPATRKISMSSTKRRKNPTHPARKRRSTSMAASKRRTNPARRRRNPAPRRRRNPSYDYKAALIESAGFVGGAFVSGWINGAMNDIFVKDGEDFDDRAAKTLGIIKIVGSLGIFALGQYVKQNPSMLGGYSQQYQQYAGAIENFTVAGSAVALADGLDLVFKEEKRNEYVANPSLLDSNKTSEGTRRRRRRSMRGVIVQSPTLQRQLSTSGMSGTNMLPMHGAMRGSLEVYGSPQPSLVAMQASAAPQRSYYGGGPMSGSAYGSCI